MATELPLDRRQRVRDERDAAFAVEAACGNDESDGGDLEQVLVRLAPAREAAGERPDERQMLEDEIQNGIPGRLHGAIVPAKSETVKVFLSFT
jgi:hypothetical protein